MKFYVISSRNILYKKISIFKESGRCVGCLCIWLGFYKTYGICKKKKKKVGRTTL